MSLHFDSHKKPRGALSFRKAPLVMHQPRWPTYRVVRVEAAVVLHDVESALAVVCGALAG
jgi:hypothetical protein